MTEAERGDEATLFPKTVGERLRAAREAQGLSLAEIAARTRIPQRHLEAIETSNFAGLPSATYAVGFVRGYARAVGADEVELARDTRVEVANTVRTKPQYEPYEIADPSRVPSRGVVIAAAGLGLAVLVLAILWFTTSVFRGGGGAVDPHAPIAATAPVVVAPVSSSTPVASGQVALVANAEVWVRVYDADDKTLYLGTMKPGERFDVPPDANNPMINVGRPDQLTVMLNGSKVAPLGAGDRAIKDVPIGAAALTARQARTPLASPSPSPSASVPAAFASPSRSRDTTERPRTRPASRRAAATPRPQSSPARDGPENLLPKGFAAPAATPTPQP